MAYSTSLSENKLQDFNINREILKVLIELQIEKMELIPYEYEPDVRSNFMSIHRYDTVMGKPVKVVIT